MTNTPTTTTPAQSNVVYMFNQTDTNLPEGYLPSTTLQAALDIVSNAHDSGLLMVPNTPTVEMIEAAQSLTGLSEEEIQKIWHAMLQAW